MANPAHLKILRKGARVWNEWRRKNRDTIPDLSRVNFKGADLSEVILVRTRLRNSNFEDLDLIGVCLDYSDLTGAKLNNANLTAAYIQTAILDGADLEDAFLWNTFLCGTRSHGANFKVQTVKGSNFWDIDLEGVTGLEEVVDLHYCNLFAAKNVPHVAIRRFIELGCEKHPQPESR